MTADNWGCPDWRDKDSYPKNGESLEDWQWHWEFLRRVSWYRNMWAGLSLNFDELPSESVDWLWLQEKGAYGDKLKYLKYITAMDFLNNPSCSNLGEKELLSRGKGGSELPFPEVEGLLDKSISKYTYIRFDTGRAIKPQIESAEKILNAKAEIKRTPRMGGKDRNNWPTYLRLIDAEDQAAKPMEIFRQFEAEGNYIVDNAANEASKIMGMIEAARDVQEKGYLFL